MKAIPFRGVAFVFRQAFFRPATRRTRRTGRVQPRRSGDALRNHTKRNSQVYKIMEEKKLSDSFVVLSLHFIKQCSDKWKRDYWDRRDIASVKMCRDIVLCPEFSRFYESRCGKESGIWELCTGGGVCHKDMLLGVRLIHGIYDMHPTNRQTLAGLILSFYANSPKMEKLSKAGHKSMGLPYHENVGFVMI